MKENADIRDKLNRIKKRIREDVDLCLRLLDRGYTNIFTPFCEAYHYESLSRGYEDTPQKQRRLAKEKAILRAKHRRILEEPDPFYDTNGL